METETESETQEDQGYNEQDQWRNEESDNRQHEQYQGGAQETHHLTYMEAMEQYDNQQE